MTRLELVSIVAARLVTLTGVSMSLALECARNAVCALDGDDGAPSLEQAVHAAVEHRHRTQVQGVCWSNAVADVAKRLGSSQGSAIDWIASEVARGLERQVVVA